MEKKLPKYMHHKHGAYYHVRDGKWHPLGKDLEKAIAAQQVFLGGDRAGVVMMPDLIARALPHVLLGKHGKGVAQRTRQTYSFYAGKLQAVWADIPALEFCAAHLYEVRNSLKARGQVGKFNVMVTVARQVLRWAVEKGIIKINPISDVERLPFKHRERLIEPAEWEKIYKAASKAMRLVMDLCYFTGQRIGDVLGIKLSDITAEGIYFVQQKTKARQCIQWTPELRAVVERARAFFWGNVTPLRDAHLITFRNGKRAAYKTINRHWVRAVKVSGVTNIEGTHLHDVRAMAASDVERAVSEAGGDGGTAAQHLLGHTSRKTTNIYLRDKRTTFATGPTAARRGARRKEVA